MRHQLRDLFSDIIEAAKETGTWQAMTVEEKGEVVDYFFRHFDEIVRRAGWLKFSRVMTIFAAEMTKGAPSARQRQESGGAREDKKYEDELLGVQEMRQAAGRPEVG